MQCASISSVLNDPEVIAADFKYNKLNKHNYTKIQSYKKCKISMFISSMTTDATC